MLTYSEALQAIFQRTNLERQTQPPYSERVWRLARMRKLLEDIGDPQTSYPAVHIAGTKGKGSTTAMIESVLRAAGYRTGMYTSPHLHTFRERIRLNGQPVLEEEVAHAVEILSPHLAASSEITVFEAITAMAMLLFAEQHVDWGVFEVGLGGRLDATNVLMPAVAVITSISLDHVRVLGDTVDAIAREKAGIIKPYTPVVSSIQTPTAMRVVEEIAHERSAPLIAAGRDWHWRLLNADMGGQTIAVFREDHGDSPEYPELKVPLLGIHQVENACTAVAAIEVLRGQGVEISSHAVTEGLANVSWPGRMEIVNTTPLLMLDGAHNTDSLQRLLVAIDEYLKFDRAWVVFGANVTHNPEELLHLLGRYPRLRALYLTQSQHAKAAPVAELLHLTGRLDEAFREDADIVPTRTVEGALKTALVEADAHDLILVTGSLFVVAEAREAWFREAGLPPPPSDPPGIY